ncbi:MAG: hypothetical protein EGP82_03375 [Odoribacter splanchnicus]|nr:hypothetical protein [Odoribacter splanchnicus]
MKKVKNQETAKNANVTEAQTQTPNLMLDLEAVDEPVQTTALVLVTETPEAKAKRLEKEILELKDKLKKVPQTLEQKIEFYQVKQQKIKQLDKLEKSSNELFEHIEELDKLTETDDFVCDKYKLSVTEKSAGYNEGSVFQMNNPVIIRDVIKFVLQRIDDKISVLKMEIAE